ncbi:MAG: hypothetical protein HY394_01795 [Candidatus Diapherotrites archaeon]|nr:hypothetical protein [Candidatus Diapherotrites archaeon]
MIVEKEITAKNCTAAFNSLKAALISDGWVEKHEEPDSFEFEKMAGDTKFPENHKITWLARATKGEGKILAEIEVPLFVDWQYSRKRIEKGWRPIEKHVLAEQKK